MTAHTTSTTEWELDVQSVKMRRWIIIGASVLMLGHIGAALVLRGGEYTGANLRLADQIAMIAIGLVVSGFTLMYARPRLRAGAAGIEVRKVFGERRLSWDEVGDLSFDHGGPWARLELPHDEYLPVAALQVRDGQHAVDAVDSFRRLRARYGGHVGTGD
ncbi:PH domain-containing protein [Rhodococcus sp. O3]|uniref:PH domain-containing protein n=1 Tax=Rhodococcus sp. O3 TaxID=3404919 RepID=UPI003B67AF5A